jgi:uncharacterized membrane protein
VAAPIAVLLVHLLATAFMAGLIWFVQVVHYPLMAEVGAERFVDYEQRHQSRTSLVVGPPMAVEGVTTVLLFLAPPAGVGRMLPFIGGVLLAVVLGSTVLVQVPLHGRLGQSFDPATVRRLVATNWVRTAGWSARALLAAVMLARHAGT